MYVTYVNIFRDVNKVLSPSYCRATGVSILCVFLILSFISMTLFVVLSYSTYNHKPDNITDVQVRHVHNANL
jgi:hypothetical protein